MIKQGIVQEAMAEISGPAHLPPLNNLPQWSRINTFDKARYPKPFPRDKLQPISHPSLDGASPESIERRGSHGSSGSIPDLDIPENMNASQRVQHLERSIRFLTHQHAEILGNLHDEIERLKRANKELQFRLVIMQKGMSPPHSPQKQLKQDNTTRTTVQKSTPSVAKAPHHNIIKGSEMSGNHFPYEATSSKMMLPKIPRRVLPCIPFEIPKPDHSEPAPPTSISKQKSQDETLDSSVEDNALQVDNNVDAVSEPAVSQGTEDHDELKIIFLEEEIKELKKTLKEERLRNNYLTQLLEQAQKLKVQPQSDALLEDGTGVIAHSKYDLDKPEEELKLPYNATITPLQVHLPSAPPRPPTLAECEVIMKHMQQTNDRQAHELNQLKSDLRDVLYSHKWTPDAYLLAKAYVAEDDAKEAAERDRLPKIQLRQQTRKLPDIAYINRENVMLPALTQTLGNKAIERRKRTQILQKARMKREVNSASAKA